MKISAKIDYACRAILELALHWPNTTPLQIQVIARRQNIPIKFLTHILINLKQQEYVESTRGKNGGYLLRRIPRDINLKDVMSALGGWESVVTQNNGRNHSTKHRHVLSKIWQELDEAVCRPLEGLNFEILCERVRKADQALIFDI